MKTLKIEGKNLRKYVNNMLENSFKFFFVNYWRSIDKKNITLLFFVIFFRLVFSFSSAPLLLQEKRLNKDYYFFFTKHLIYTFLAITIMITMSVIKTEILIKLVLPYL